ncbi:helix-turn-helix domain-containing protein [Streptococcus hongkongensis]|nr:membrane protein [Streptococcus uberis]
MREKSLGEILRKSRVGKNITLDDIENISGISSHYLLAMELDQYKIIPEHKLDQFLKQYAEIVGLDFTIIKNKYIEQMAQKSNSQEPSVTQIVENKLSHRIEDKISFSRQAKANDSKPQKDELKSKKEDYSENTSFENDDHVYFESSRQSRISQNQKKSKSIFLVILLTIIALIIFAFLFFAVWQQMNKENKAKNLQTEQVTKSVSSQNKTETSSSIQPKTEITSQGQDNYLEATVKKSKESVKLTVSLKDTESSWISLTNSDIGETGITLTKENPTYSTTIDKDVSEALLTLGITQGVSVLIDGQPLDLSPITVTDTSYITLKFQK